MRVRECLDCGGPVDGKEARLCSACRSARRKSAKHKTVCWPQPVKPKISIAEAVKAADAAGMSYGKWAVNNG